MTALRIAMVAPPYYEVPPTSYGGVETVVAGLVDGLVRAGHHVTLIGAGARGTSAQEFVAASAEATADHLGEAVPELLHAARVARVLDSGGFDLVHDHTLAGPLLARGRRTPTLVTVHGQVGGDNRRYYRELGDSVGLVAISRAQRATAPELNWVATIYNGIDVSSFLATAGSPEPYALFLGRFHVDKGPHLAIDAARSVGLPITLAGKCTEPGERAYFDAEILPRLGSDVTIQGPARGAEKRVLLSGASCLLFPVCWDEPFGLVIVEALASGTPVVALRRGSVPELLTDGYTGEICDEPAQLPDAIRRAAALRPSDCRTQALDRFDVEPMITGYLAAYRAILERPALGGKPGVSSPYLVGSSASLLAAG